MKATDLMIGDWVSIGMNYLDRIDMIKTNAIRLERAGNLLPVEQLEPIPLTPEILEKNGWKHPYWWENPDCQFGLVKYTEGSWAEGKWGVMFNTEDNDPSFLINYVHELQHLYRLCGIEKEIML